MGVGGGLVAVDHAWSWNGGAVLVIDIAVSDSRGGVVAWTHIWARSTKRACRDGSLEIHGSGAVVLLFSLPEVTLSVTSGVVVGRRWSVSLLLLARSDEEDLHQSTEQEDEGTDDGYDENSLVQAACGAWRHGVCDVVVEAGVCGTAKGASSDDSRGARVHSSASENGDGDESTHD